MVNKYGIEITLTRDMLGTNPCDPNILDTHIINRQRKLILEKSKVNTTINKYLDQIQISAERGEEETNRLLDSIEKITGYTFTEEERGLAISGRLETLKETFKEFDRAGTTIFLWDNDTDRPCIGDHMIYGFLKSAAEAIGRTLPKKQGTVFHSVSYTQSLINQHVRCDKQFIPFDRDVKKDKNGNPWFKQRSLRAMTAQGPRISLAKSEVVEAGAKLKFELKVMKGSPIEEGHIKKMLEYGEISGLGQWRNSGWGQFTFEMMQL